MLINYKSSGISGLVEHFLSCTKNPFLSPLTCLNHSPFHFHTSKVSFPMMVLTKTKMFKIWMTVDDGRQHMKSVRIDDLNIKACICERVLYNEDVNKISLATTHHRGLYLSLRTTPTKSVYVEANKTCLLYPLRSECSPS